MMSINNRLTTFAQQELVLAHNDTERARIEASLGQLEKVITNKLGSGVASFVRFGSFTRNTILPRQYDRLSDVDLMVVFNTSEGKKTPETYRKTLMNIVSAAYPNSISKKDFPVVKLELTKIMFDIVPAYRETSAWDGSFNYFIPDRENGWRRTTPNDLNKPLQEKNQAVGNNMVRNTIRLCKHWNASAGYVYESYLLEKSILNTIFYWGNNLHDNFLSVLNNVAGNDPGVRLALGWIERYRGTWTQPADEKKQFEWLQRLLPGLK